MLLSGGAVPDGGTSSQLRFGSLLSTRPNVRGICTHSSHGGLCAQEGALFRVEGS